VPKAFECAESLFKPVKLTLASFQKWGALCCQFFKRELFLGNIFGEFKNRRAWHWPVSEHCQCNSAKSVGQ
jgi:hypothetical protein